MKQKTEGAFLDLSFSSSPQGLFFFAFMFTFILSFLNVRLKKGKNLLEVR